MVSLAAEKVKSVRKRDGFYHYNGKQYAAVTSILSVIAKPALVYWGAKTAAGLVLSDPDQWDSAEKAASGIYGVRDKAADRGSTIHSLIEAFARRGQVEIIPEAFKGYADAFWAWAAAVQPTPLYSEANCYSDAHSYAGTLDLISTFPDKSIQLVDFKSSSGIYPEVGLQLEAYRRCEFIVPHVNGEHPIPMPPVAGTVCVLLKDDGTFVHQTVTGDFDAFLAAKTLWTWSTKGKR